MKLNNKFFYFLLAGFVVSTGCKKELDKQPTSTFSPDNAYETVADLQLGTNEVYARYNAYLNDIYVNSLISDEAKLGVDNAGQGALTYRFQYASDGTSGADVIAAYSGYYSMIDQVNSVLSFIPQVIAPAEETRKNVLRGQLLALRAVAHFSLLEFYADRYDPAKSGVPIMLQSEVFVNKPRHTQGEVMAQIEKDLADAKALLPAVTPASFSDTVMNQVNIAGYQARIALYKRDYSAAITHATTVINSMVKPLASAATFPNIWQDLSSAEVLMRRRMATSTALGALYTLPGGQIYISPSDKLVAALPATDVRRATFIGTSGGNNYVNKHFTSPRGGRAVDIKIMRISEMYLIRAEAYARTGNAGDVALGAADLNTLRAARITGYTPVTFATGEALAIAVLDERFKELCFEGFRFFDLKRNYLPVLRLASDASPEWQTLAAGNFRFTMPIPLFELQANPATVQNPGY
jgi:hypothetical protein